jgi:hypothetical protein
MTLMDMLFTLAVAILAAGNLWALRSANESAAERKAIRADVHEVREALTAFRLEAAKSYVAREHLAVLEERIVRTEERLLAEFREFRTSITAALSTLAAGRRPQRPGQGE